MLCELELRGVEAHRAFMPLMGLGDIKEAVKNGSGMFAQLLHLCDPGKVTQPLDLNHII